jgi:SOS-response transcriptional repressor LexA
MRQEDAADKSGVKLGHYSRIELGHYQSLKDDVRVALARAFEMTPEAFSSYIYGDNTVIQKSSDTDIIFELDKRIQVLPIPIRGYINAGTPGPAEAVDLGVAWVEKVKISGAKKMDAVFSLKVNGDSLLGDGIKNGDIVFVEPNPDMIEGKIYVIRLDNEVVARHVHRENGFAVLTSSNGKYARIEVEKLEVLGRVIGAQSPDFRSF